MILAYHFAVHQFSTAHVIELGYAAAFCTTAAFVPQLMRVIRLHSAREISLPTFMLFSVGVFFWLIYGLAIWSMPVIVSNLITLGISVSILVLKLRYDRHAIEEIEP
ncbi:MAG: SemiSWEET transporter [Acidobacteriaceae bacterium]|nr:SemiSWEET transporter [Acidobacteriaceae bacterium]